MSDVLDVFYRLRDMAADASDKLAAATAEAKVTLDRLEAFAADAERSAELLAASDLFPYASANIPPESGLVHKGEQ